MNQVEEDKRSAQRRALDEKIAAEPPLAIPNVPPNVKPMPVEAHLRRARKPIALAGIVENGVVHFVDKSVKLPERSRVIVVAESG